MASLSAIPDKFSSGNFVSWLQSFECCATVNEWEDDDKLKKLPAFLRCPSAAYFHGLPDGQKDTHVTFGDRAGWWQVDAGGLFFYRFRWFCVLRS